MLFPEPPEVGSCPSDGVNAGGESGGRASDGAGTLRVGCVAVGIGSNSVGTGTGSGGEGGIAGDNGES